MTDLTKRLARISGKKRKLLEGLLREQGIRVPVEMKADENPRSPGQTASTRSKEFPQGEIVRPRRPETEGRADYASLSAVQKKCATSRVYSAYHEKCNSTIFGPHSFFMNLGYVPNENREYSPIQIPKHVPNKNSIKLALEVIGDCDLSDREILDVGCGRGGTIHVIQEYYDPKATVGVDLSGAGVAFCQETHCYPTACFTVGDAESLPFRELSFDVVINIESSHSYPDRSAFYREVWRVLRPGGYFLYSDVLQVEAFCEALGMLKGLGFVLERDHDITKNVLLSCQNTARFQFEAFARDSTDEWMANALGVPGSKVYQDMKDGVTPFRIARLRKP